MMILYKTQIPTVLHRKPRNTVGIRDNFLNYTGENLHFRIRHTTDTYGDG